LTRKTKGLQFLPEILAERDSVPSVGDTAMTDKESLTGIEQEVQVEERTRHAMETYVNWLQNAMSASPWTNVDLNKKLLNYATENVSAAVGLVEKLSHAKNLEDVVVRSPARDRQVIGIDGREHRNDPILRL
jgi:hypothetical protein